MKTLFAAMIVAGLAIAPAAFAEDAMKPAMTKDKMDSKMDKMDKKDSMSNSSDKMKKTTDGMMDKKDTMSKDEMKK